MAAKVKTDIKEKRIKLLGEARQLETQIGNAQQQTMGLQNFINQATIRLAQLRGKLELLDELHPEDVPEPS